MATGLGAAMTSGGTVRAKRIGRQSVGTTGRTNRSIKFLRFLKDMRKFQEQDEERREAAGSLPVAPPQEAEQFSEEEQIKRTEAMRKRLEEIESQKSIGTSQVIPGENTGERLLEEDPQKDQGGIVPIPGEELRTMPGEAPRRKFRGPESLTDAPIEAGDRDAGGLDTEFGDLDPNVQAAVDVLGQEIVDSMVSQGMDSASMAALAGAYAKSLGATGTQAAKLAMKSGALGVLNPQSIAEFFNKGIGYGINIQGLSEAIGKGLEGQIGADGKPLSADDVRGFVDGVMTEGGAEGTVGPDGEQYAGSVGSKDLAGKAAEAGLIDTGFFGGTDLETQDMSVSDMVREGWISMGDLDKESQAMVRAKMALDNAPGTGLGHAKQAIGDAFRGYSEADVLGAIGDWEDSAENTDSDTGVTWGEGSADQISKVMEAAKEMAGAVKSGLLDPATLTGPYKDLVPLIREDQGTAPVADTRSIGEVTAGSTAPAAQQEGAVRTAEAYGGQGGRGQQQSEWIQIDQNANEASRELSGAGDIGAEGGMCIIVTACTHPGSEEVNITRRFRDECMTDLDLAGYYNIAHRVVPRIHESEKIKKYIKKYLVDRLIDYGKVYFKEQGRCRYKTSPIITRAFLFVCKISGMLTTNADQLLEMHRG